jgi:transcriptional regulator with XRE-family HTH domain
MTPDQKLQQVGDKIRAERLGQDMRQVVLARLIKSAPSTICDIESGRKTPSWALIQKIAKALNVSLDILTDD